MFTDLTQAAFLDVVISTVMLVSTVSAEQRRRMSNADLDALTEAAWRVFLENVKEAVAGAR